MGKQWLFRFEEISGEDKDLVGKKCANVGEMTRMGLPVPPGFAISLDGYNRFLSETNASHEIGAHLDKYGREYSSLSQWEELSGALRQIVESQRMPKDMTEAITSYYYKLSRKYSTSDMAVSVRSAGVVSHPGQYETYLNIKGSFALIEKVIKVWSSSFNPRSLAYRARNGLPLESDPIGVAVMGMINARTAGVILTAEPNTGDNSKIVCEANWGLGESVVSGCMTPDYFIVDKESLDILERRLGKKTSLISCSKTGVIKEDIVSDKRSAFCLSNEELREIARFAKIIEKHFNGVPQDIEWAICYDLSYDSNIFFLQTRSAIISQKKSSTDQIIDLIISRKLY